MKNLKNREKKRISKERMVHEVNENHIGIQEFKILDQIPADRYEIYNKNFWYLNNLIFLNIFC